MRLDFSDHSQLVIKRIVNLIMIMRIHEYIGGLQ